MPKGPRYDTANLFDLTSRQTAKEDSCGWPRHSIIKGIKARGAGVAWEANPFASNTEEHDGWIVGWNGLLEMADLA